MTAAGATTVDPEALIELKAAIDDYLHATRAWQRRAALEHYVAVADPALVRALIAEYIADAPTNAELDDVAGVLRVLAGRLEAFGTQTPEATGFVAVVAVSGDITIHMTGDNRMAFTLQTGQQVSLTVAYQDAHGNPAEVESQAWTSSDEAILTVTDNADGTASAASTGTVGTAQVVLTADARFGDEVVDITGVLDVDVVAAEAVTAVITPGEPTDVPAGG